MMYLAEADGSAFLMGMYDKMPNFKMIIACSILFAVGAEAASP